MRNEVAVLREDITAMERVIAAEDQGILIGPFSNLDGNIVNKDGVVVCLAVEGLLEGVNNDWEKFSENGEPVNNLIAD